MKTIPPHLPPKTNSVKLHNLKESLKTIFLISVLGIFAGFAGASVVLGWIWPYAGEGETWAISRNRSTLSMQKIEERVMDETSKRTVKIYKDKTANRLDPTDLLANAVVVSSDGWVVFYLNENVNNFKSWQVLDSEGKIWNIDKTVRDVRSDLIYAHLKNANSSDRQFKVVGFDNDLIKSGEEVYVLENGNWYYSFVNYPVYSTSGESHLDGAVAVEYSLNNKFNKGEIVITPQGKVAGFITKNGNLLPYFAITRILPNILSEQVVAYASLGAEGYLTFESPFITDSGAIDGFFVSKIVSTKSSLKRGDLITEINGEKINQENFGNQFIGIDKASLKVYRNGDFINITSSIINI